MALKNILILIPARYQSSRFPGKPLAPIAGKTMIQRVYENCQRAEETEEAKKEGLSIHVGVVTDNDKIEDHVKETSSKYAQNILDNWDNEKLLFWQIVPKEMINKFDQPVLIKEEKSA